MWGETTHKELKSFRWNGAGETVHGCSLLFSQYDFTLSLFANLSQRSFKLLTVMLGSISGVDLVAFYFQQ